VIEDALSYIDLVYYWPAFTRAIERLSIIENMWLFEAVE
jgi:hypothetical protein